MSCSTQTYSNDGICCDRCPAGQYVKDHCKAAQKTTCAVCPHGSHTATENHLMRCLTCKECKHKNGRTVRTCTAKENTVCGCETGFYCSDDTCDHCQLLTRCLMGRGVTLQASQTRDLKCDPCKEGTYSDVTDFSSPCVPHTSCESLGRELKTPGNVTTDAVCGNFKTYCPWMLPAGLWVGLVLTIIVAAAFIFWRVKRRSHREDSSCVPVSHVEFTPGPIIALPDLKSHCQESCTENDCKLPLFTSDHPPISCSTEDSLDTRLPITPLKASVSFAESSHTNGSAKYITTNFCRSYSEPQEDEWCGAS